jgi:putative oxidoreductase
MFKSLENWSPIPLRAVLGFGFVYHGFPKLFSAAGHDMFVGMLQGIGVPLPEMTAWFVGMVELAGGLALLAGALTSVAGLVLIVNMLVALLTVHLPQGFNFIHITGMSEAGPQFGMPGYEVPLLYVAGLAALVVSGPGPFSVDERVNPTAT